MGVGVLPVRYLGIPLSSKKLSAGDCDILIQKNSGRIDSWLSKHLITFAGRLQLISSVLYSIQMYWTSVFILPKRLSKSNKFSRCATWEEIRNKKTKVEW
jgi:hypothetical protein